MFLNMFTPHKIGNVLIKNRLVVSAMVTQYCEEDGMATERYIAYHEAKAKGGWGLIITEDYPVNPHCGSYVKLPALWEDAQIESHRRLTERVHAHGAKICCQLYHAGRGTNGALCGGVPLAPSPLKDPARKDTPRAMTVDEIHEVTRQFAECALRAKKAGFDMVELHAGHGYLIAQFLSAFANRRTDTYGGSLYNRARFMREVITEVKKAVGEDFPVLVRISTFENVDGGLSLAETRVIARMAQEAGASAIHASQGTRASRIDIIPPYGIKVAAYANNAAEIKSAVGIPVIGAGRINDPFVAESLLASGKMNFVTMARASLADPELPNKVREGRFDELAYCIGCLQGCAGQNGRSKDGIRCLVNPGLGKEYQNPLQPAEKKKKVAVVGGGISGCETALVAASRGHDVTLFEKNDELGGQWTLEGMPPGKGEFETIPVWQRARMEKAGVQIQTGTEVTKEMLSEMKPDVLVLATGSTPAKPPLAGLDQDHVASAHDVLSCKVSPGTNTVVIGGGLVGAETADFCAQLGAKVTILEMLPQICKDGEPQSNELLFENFKKFGVDVYVNAKYLNADKTTVTFEYAGEVRRIENVDRIIVAVGVRPYAPLKETAEELGIQVLCTGDASGAKNGLRNMWEGFDTGAAI